VSQGRVPLSQPKVRKILDTTSAKDSGHYPSIPTRYRPGRINCSKGPAEVFATSSSARPSTPEVDIKALHAKIGELTLENGFLESALDKAGLLSARR
jgi:transposase